MELVKVQIPQATNDPEAPSLVYDKDRKHPVLQLLDDATKEAIGTDAKAFFEAEYTDGYWKIGRRVSHQDW